MNITERMALAAKKLAGAELRKAGIPDLAQFEPHKLEWGDLNARQKALAVAARKLLDKVGDDADEARAKETELAHDALMEAWDECELEKNARTQLGSREPRSQGGSPNRPIPPSGSARGQDDGLGLSTGDGEATEAFALAPEQRMADWHLQHGGRDDFRGLTVGAYLRSMVIGPKSDVERRALAEGTDSAGGYSVPDLLSARMIDRLRAASVVFRAGAQTVPLGSDTNYVAKVATDPSPAWRNENAAVGESDPTFARVTLTPRSLMVMVRVSRELLEDSVNMETVLPRIIAAGMAAEVDRACLFGTGTPPEPQGVANFAGLTTNAYAGGALTSYAPLITARTALRTANSDVTAYVLHPRDEGTLAGLTASDNQPLMVPPAIASVPMLTTTAVPVNGGVGVNESSILAGDWSRLMVGFRNQLRIEVLRERYADLHQYAFVAHLRMDCAAEHEAAFTELAAITA